MTHNPPVRDSGRARAFAVVLPALLVAHNLGDHIVQTDHQAAHKATSWTAMAGHVSSYTATCATALALTTRATGVQTSWRRTLAGLAFSAITHAVLDRRWPVIAILRRTGSPGFATSNTIRAGAGGDQPLPLHGPYLADQALHHVCLLASALIIAGGAR